MLFNGGIVYEAEARTSHDRAPVNSPTLTETAAGSVELRTDDARILTERVLVLESARAHPRRNVSGVFGGEERVDVAYPIPA